MKVGLNGKSYYGTAGAEPAIEITAIRDVSLSIEVSVAEMTSRLSTWKDTEAAIKSASVDFELVWDATNASQAAIKTACLAGTKTAFKFVDAAAGYGYWGDFIITGFGMEQPLEDGMTVPVTLVSSGALTVESPV